MEEQPFHHIYGVGKRYYAGVMEELDKRGIDLREYPRVDMREYIYDMPVCMAAADVVLSRAGASTIAEISEIAKPSILVPSPNVTANHQEKNARVLSDQGAAVLMLEQACDGDQLYEQVRTMTNDPEGLNAMSRKLAAIAVTDANERIYQTLKGIMK
jgi:UDP-N-acetylglucosamine--N-acetylmuramyl-(pentapeptide) pyrophosphoryl-undecaprenol N-acetylglucosamine transferase